MKVSRTKLDEANSAEARRYARMQEAVIKQFKQAALDYLKETEGRDLEAERPSWTGYTIETDWKKTGQVIVRQYQYDERAPRTLIKTWEIDKKKLVK